MTRKRLSELLSENSKSGKYPMHMPGHKRNEKGARNTLSASLFPYDITEIEGFDNLHDAHGILAEIQRDAASLYGAGHAHLLVNGSTCGILASVRAATMHGDKVLVSRASHKSVYHAIELCGLDPIYLLPELDPESGFVSSVTPEGVERALKESGGASLVVITSPSYEGVVSDIPGIARVAHKYGARLIVDSAHGAHRGLFGDAFGSRAFCGYADADYVVLSLHKTLPSLTQTALLLSNLDEEDEGELCRQLGIFETSSPSYILMASIDDCISMLSQEMFYDWHKRLSELRESLSGLKNLKLVKKNDAFFDYDISKLVISSRGTSMTGAVLTEILRRRNIEPEMTGDDYVVLMTSPLDSAEGYYFVMQAILHADTMAKRSDKISPTPIYTVPPRKILLSDAVEQNGAEIDISNAEGRVSLSYLWAYPPGIPLVIPGEVVTREIVAAVQSLRQSGVEIPNVIKAL